MDAQEAMLLLLRRARVLPPTGALEQTSPADRAAAEAIAQEMDGLPLALDQAGVYIEETQCSLTSDLLRFLSFLAPDAVPEPLVIEGAYQLGPTLQPLATDESLLDEAIVALARYSLVKRKREDSTLTVHRLVQAVLKNGMDEQTQHQWAEYAVRAVNEAFPDVGDYRNWPRCQQFLPHVQTCAALIDQWQFAFSEAGRLCNEVGIYLGDHAQYAEAETFYQRAIAIGEKTLGPEHPDLATWLSNLAILYNNQGKNAEAEPLYRRAIAIGEKTLGAEHPYLAIWLNNGSYATLLIKKVVH